MRERVGNMGCGASRDPSIDNKTRISVRPQEQREDERSDGDDDGVPLVLIAADEMSMVEPHTKIKVQFKRESGHVVCYANGNVRQPDVRRMHFDEYYSFLRFPDNGRSGKVPRNARLPELLGKLMGVCEGTSCKLQVPDRVPCGDLPGGFVVGCTVKATDEIQVGGGTVAVLKGGTGTAMNKSGDRISVRWHQRLDGKKKKICVLPGEIKWTTDLPAGFLRGHKITRKDNTRITGVVTSNSRSKNPNMLRVRWDKGGTNEDISASEIKQFVYDNQNDTLPQ